MALLRHAKSQEDGEREVPPASLACREQGPRVTRQLHPEPPAQSVTAHCLSSNPSNPCILSRTPPILILILWDFFFPGIVEPCSRQSTGTINISWRYISFLCASQEEEHLVLSGYVERFGSSQRTDHHLDLSSHLRLWPTCCFSEQRSLSTVREGWDSSAFRRQKADSSEGVVQPGEVHFSGLCLGFQARPWEQSEVSI